MIKFKKISLYTLFVLSLFIGFILQENSSGGAKIDHDFFQIYINFFYLDFYDGLEKFLENSKKYSFFQICIYIQWFLN